MNKIETYVTNAINIANDDTHGYSQVNRWGPDYDCASMVITAIENAGIPVKTNGASFTGNMYAAFLHSGFKDVTSGCDNASAKGMARGDVLIRPYGHTAIYLGNGKIVDAVSDENGKIQGTKKGDQTGKEIATRSYYNGNWKYVLRYPESSTNVTSNNDETYKDGKIYIKGEGYTTNKDKSYIGKYKTKTECNLFSKTNANSKVLVNLPKGATLINFGGHFSLINKTVWIDVTYETKTHQFDGFIQLSKLTKV